MKFAPGDRVYYQSPYTLNTFRGTIIRTYMSDLRGQDSEEMADVRFDDDPKYQDDHHIYNLHFLKEANDILKDLVNV